MLLRQSRKKKASRGGVPDVSDMSSLSSGGRMPTSLSEDAKVYVAIMKFCTNGSVYGEELSTDVMYAMQFATSMPKSPLYLMS
eukprot:12403512-Karenia_brevis.AAC.1